MLVALKLGLTRLLCVYNVLLSKITKKFVMEEFSKKVSLSNLDRKLEEFKSKKEKNRPKHIYNPIFIMISNSGPKRRKRNDYYNRSSTTIIL